MVVLHRVHKQTLPVVKGFWTALEFSRQKRSLLSLHSNAQMMKTVCGHCQLTHSLTTSCTMTHTTWCVYIHVHIVCVQKSYVHIFNLYSNTPTHIPMPTPTHIQTILFMWRLRAGSVEQVLINAFFFWVSFAQTFGSAGAGNMKYREWKWTFVQRQQCRAERMALGYIAINDQFSSELPYEDVHISTEIKVIEVRSLVARTKWKPSLHVQIWYIHTHKPTQTHIDMYLLQLYTLFPRKRRAGFGGILWWLSISCWVKVSRFVQSLNTCCQLASFTGSLWMVTNCCMIANSLPRLCMEKTQLIPTPGPWSTVLVWLVHAHVLPLSEL